MVRQKQSPEDRSIFEGTPPGAPASTPSYGGNDRNMEMFIWQKLDTIEQRFILFSEKYGEHGAKLESINERLQKSDTKLSEVHDSVKHAKYWMFGAFAVIGVLFTLYKIFESKIHFG